MRTKQILFFAILMFAFTANAQSVMKFYMKNGTEKNYVISSIDSVKFRPSPVQLPTVTDVDGNVYHYITIGTQTWMVENLRTTRYRNGDLIGTTSSMNQDIFNEAEPKYQWPCNADESLVAKYGRFYTGYAVIDSRNLAPTGWRVATYNDWHTLSRYLQANGYNYDNTSTDSKIAKSLASITNWSASDAIGTPGNNPSDNNKSGLTAYPTGWRRYNGTFEFLGTRAIWWSMSDEHLYYENGVMILNGYIDFQSAINILPTGMAVRCIKE